MRFFIGLIAQKIETSFSLEQPNDSSITIYPNPLQNKSTVSFETKVDGFTRISIYSIDGKMVISTNEYLTAGNNSFLLSLPKGVFILQTSGSKLSEAVQIISQSTSKVKPEIVYIGNENTKKTAPSNIGMMRTNEAYAPTISSFTILTIGHIYVVGLANISSAGPTGTVITDRGICWSKASVSTHPTLLNSSCKSGSGTGTFSTATNNMSHLTTYYVSAYATNNLGYTTISDPICIQTADGAPFGLPTLNTMDVTSISSNYAITGGIITNQGATPVTARGICWSTLPNPTIDDNKNVCGSGIGTFQTIISNLSQAGTYYIRAYATNGPGTNYGNEICFKTAGCKVGDYFENGIIAYFYKQGEEGYQPNVRRGILVTPSDLTSAMWYNGTYSSVGAQKTGLGTAGRENTSKIYNNFGIGNYAAYLCLDLTIGGHNDWYLPSKDELNKLYINKHIIGGFSNGKYWSSSEDNIPQFAWSQDFSTGNQTLDNKSGKYHVRGIRQFHTSISIPAVTTLKITSKTSTRVLGGGNIPYDVGAQVTMSGICWNTTGNPTIEDNYTTDGSIIGSYTSTLTNLTFGQNYYIRAYATNSVGTAYGEQINFIYSYPLLTTITASSINHNSAITGGNISTDGGQSIITRGVCWDTNPNPTIANSKTSNGSGLGVFESSLTGLTANTIYYVRAYAVYNNTDVEYGNQIQFTTSPATPPALTISNPTSITSNSAICETNITDDGGASITARGVCWSTTHNPTTENNKTSDGNGIGTLTSSITGLLGNTTYYVRAYATNNIGTAYSEQCSFKTLVATIPTITTTAVTSINSTTESSGGNVTSNGGSPVTARGVCWNTSPNPTTANNKTINGSGTGSFTSNITGLILGQTYYLRAFATNNIGTAYGNEISFKTKLAIGEAYEGGIIAYILLPSDIGYNPVVQHGLIAAPVDQLENSFSGMYWMDAINVCNNLELNDKTDWRLPTKKELLKLYNNKDIIGGFEIINFPAYWSSTSDPDNSNYATCIWFDNGLETPLYKTLHQERVRAVRDF